MSSRVIPAVALLLTLVCVVDASSSVRPSTVLPTKNQYRSLKSNLLQFQAQCIVANTSTLPSRTSEPFPPSTSGMNEDTFWLKKDQLGVIRVGSLFLTTVVEPASVCSCPVGHTGCGGYDRIIATDSKGSPSQGSPTAQPLFGEYSTSIYQNDGWTRQDTQGHTVLHDLSAILQGPAAGVGAITLGNTNGDTSSLKCCPTVYGTNPPTAGGSNGGGGGFEESIIVDEVVKESTGVVSSYQAFRNRSSHPVSNIFRLSGNTVTATEDYFGYVTKDENSLYVSRASIGRTTTVTTVVTKHPCGIDAGPVYSQQLHENVTAAEQQEYPGAWHKEGGEYALLWGNSSAGQTVVCRLTPTGTVNWTSTLPGPIIVDFVASDSGVVMMAVHFFIGGQRSDQVFALSLKHGDMEKFPFPHQIAFRPIAVGSTPGQRHFAMQPESDSLLRSVDVRFLNQELWISTCGCLNPPVAHRAVDQIHCWSNGLNASFPRGTLITFDSHTGEIFSKLNNISYNAITDFNIPPEHLHLPMQMSLPPKSPSTMIWFLGTKLPDQNITNEEENEPWHRCLIGMQLDIPRGTTCPAINPAKDDNGDDGGKQVLGKVILVIVVLLIFGFIVAIMTMGYRKVGMGGKRRSAFAGSSNSPGGIFDEEDDEGGRGRASSAMPRTGTMLLYGRSESDASMGDNAAGRGDQGDGSVQGYGTTS